MMSRIKIEPQPPLDPVAGVGGQELAHLDQGGLGVPVDI